MGWQIIFVDAGNRLRNGATAHDALVARAEDKIINVVCVKNR